MGILHPWADLYKEQAFLFNPLYMIYSSAKVSFRYGSIINWKLFIIENLNKLFMFRSQKTQSSLTKIEKIARNSILLN